MRNPYCGKSALILSYEEVLPLSIDRTRSRKSAGASELSALFKLSLWGQKDKIIASKNGVPKFKVSSKY